MEQHISLKDCVEQYNKALEASRRHFQWTDESYYSHTQDDETQHNLFFKQSPVPARSNEQSLNRISWDDSIACSCLSTNDTFLSAQDVTAVSEEEDSPIKKSIQPLKKGGGTLLLVIQRHGANQSNAPNVATTTMGVRRQGGE